MTHPQYVVTRSLSRYQLAQRYPAKYALTVEHEGWVGRYYSSQPSEVRALDYLARLHRPELSQWGLIEAGEPGEAVFYLSVKEGVVREARMITLDALRDAHIALCDAFFITSSDLLARFPNATVVEPQTGSAYALKASPMKPVIGGIGVALALALGLGFYFEPASVEAPTLIAPVSPHHDYQRAMSSAQKASEGVLHALELAAHATLAPQGWALDSIEYQDKQVRATLYRAQEGQLHVADAWRKSLPEEIKTTLDVDTLRLYRSTTQTLKAWQNTLAQAPSHHEVVDVLSRLGWQLTKGKSELISQARQHHWQLSHTVTLNELAALAKLLSNQPASLNALTVMPLEGIYFDVSLDIYYTGEKL